MLFGIRDSLSTGVVETQYDSLLVSSPDFDRLAIVGVALEVFDYDPGTFCSFDQVLFSSPRQLELWQGDRPIEGCQT
jgi:hypothetical protein